MAVVPIELFKVECDHCGYTRGQEGETEKYSYDSGLAESCAMIEDWVFNDDGDCYCPACAEVDQTTGLIALDESRRDLNNK